MPRAKDRRPDIELELPMDVGAPSLARWGLAPVLQDVDDETRFTAELLVSELVTNAAQHSGAEITDSIKVRARADDQRLRIEVSDSGRTEAIFQPIARDGLDSSGFGLWLMDRLATEWGVDQSNRTTVWFELEPEVDTLGDDYHQAVDIDRLRRPVRLSRLDVDTRDIGEPDDLEHLGDVRLRTP